MCWQQLFYCIHHLICSTVRSFVFPCMNLKWLFQSRSHIEIRILSSVIFGSHICVFRPYRSITKFHHICVCHGTWDLWNVPYNGNGYKSWWWSWWLQGISPAVKDTQLHSNGMHDNTFSHIPFFHYREVNCYLHTLKIFILVE
jgi:hypothetical protein